MLAFIHSENVRYAKSRTVEIYNIMYREFPQTSYRTELPGKILRIAMREFLHRGVKSVKMDDIANLLGISKRTLYEIYPNKEELLLECVRLHEEDYDRHMADYGCSENYSVIDIIIEFYKLQIESVTDVSATFFQDLHKYKKVTDFLEQKRSARNRNAKEFFVRGVKEGFFLSDVDFDIVLRIGQESVEYAMRTEMYKCYDMKHLMHNILFLFLRGLCTAEGIERLDAFITENKDN